MHAHIHLQTRTHLLTQIDTNKHKDTYLHIYKQIRPHTHSLTYTYTDALLNTQDIIHTHTHSFKQHTYHYLSKHVLIIPLPSKRGNKMYLNMC
jgi:hypothetical protein